MPLIVRKYDVWVTPIEGRQEWEGYDPACCIEELQPRQDMPISEEGMIVVGYEDGKESRDE